MDESSTQQKIRQEEQSIRFGTSCCQQPRIQPLTPLVPVHIYVLSVQSLDLVHSFQLVLHSSTVNCERLLIIPLRRKRFNHSRTCICFGPVRTCTCTCTRAWHAAAAQEAQEAQEAQGTQGRSPPPLHIAISLNLISLIPQASSPPKNPHLPCHIHAQCSCAHAGHFGCAIRHIG